MQMDFKQSKEHPLVLNQEQFLDYLDLMELVNQLHLIW